MAVKVATKITLPVKELFNALVAKTTPLYANKDRWGQYNYEEVIFPQARAVFKDLYPTSLYPTNEEFMDRFRKDYYKKDKALQKIVTQGEHGQEREIIFNQPAKSSTETPISGLPVGEPSQSMTGGAHTQPPNIRILQTRPSEISTPVTDKAERLAQENPDIAKTEIPKSIKDAFKNEPKYKTDPTISAPQVNQPHVPAIATKPATPTLPPKPNIASSRKINFSALKPSASTINVAKNFGSRVGVFFQRNLGKYLTAGRIATVASAGIGAVAGAGFGGTGMIGGGIAGAAFPSWVRSGGAGKFLGKVGNGAINAGLKLTNQAVNKGSGLAKKSSRRVVFWFLGFFIIFGIFAGLLGGLGGESSAPTGNVGAGTPLTPGGPVTHPVPPPVNPSELRQKIIDTFGVTMNGYDEQHLQYAWDKFWETSGTNFRNYIRGVTVTNDSGSRKEGCSNLFVQAFPEDLFKLILIHEFGHIIQDCKKVLLEEHADANTKEGGVTYYAKNAVACGSYYNIQEDYAEMIAYYLNPTTSASTARCTPDGFTNPNIKQNFPLHYNVVRRILGEF